MDAVIVGFDAKDLDVLHMMADATMRFTGMEGGPAAFMLVTKVRQAQQRQVSVPLASGAGKPAEGVNHGAGGESNADQ